MIFFESYVRAEIEVMVKKKAPDPNFPYRAGIVVDRNIPRNTLISKKYLKELKRDYFNDCSVIVKSLAEEQRRKKREKIAELLDKAEDIIRKKITKMNHRNI